MSEHLHSHAEPHSCSLSEHSLQFELRSTAASFPFLFPSTPNHHVPVPTLNLSFNPPLSVAGSLTFNPFSLPPRLLVPDPPTQLCPRQLFYAPLSTFLAKVSVSTASGFWDSSETSKPTFPHHCFLVCFIVFSQFWSHQMISFYSLSQFHPRSVNTVGNVSLE